MRCIVCEEPYQFRMKHAADPVFRDGEAIVKIRRIGICGTDYHAYQGNQPYFNYPRVLGHELSGEILQIDSSDRNGFQVGDPVAIIPYLECGNCMACRNGKPNYCMKLQVIGVHIDGGMCERIPIPVTHLIKTDGLSLDDSVLLEPMSIGAHAVRRSEIQKGEVILVIGAGPIGLGVMVFAKQRGAKVIAMDISEERLEFCKKWAKVDHLVSALSNSIESISRLTDGEFPAVVFDATGNPKSMMDAFQYVAYGGKLVFVGLVKGDITFSDPEFHKREMTLLSTRNATRVDFENVKRAIEAGSIDSKSYITHRSKFEQMIEQFESWANPSSKVIKAVVELD